MRKILLVNSNRFKQPWPVIPFGLCSVAAAAEEAGHEVKVLDLCFSKNPFNDVRGTIEKYKPEIIGVSIRNIDNGTGYNTQFLLEDVKENIIKPIKKFFRGPIIVGGPAVSINPKEILEYLDLDYAIKGDGELSFIKFLETYPNIDELKKIKGLVIRKNGKIIANNEAWRIEDLDKLPIVDPSKYINIEKYRKYNSPIQIQTKRGCCLNCSYCTYNNIEGKKYRLKSPKRVVDEIEYLYKRTGIRHIEFTDSTFNIPLKHAKDILKEIIRRNLRLNLRTMGLNPSTIDEELIDLMKKAGFMDVDLGAESGNNITLMTLGKNYSKEDVIRAGQLLQKKKIPTTWYLLVGAPGERIETLLETFNTISKAASKWDLINIGIGIRVYNGAPIANHLKPKSDNFLYPTSYKPEELSLQEIKIITKWFALNHDNFFMYDEDEKTPLLLLRIGTIILKFFLPNKPIWTLFIAIRKIQRYTGINLLKKLSFYVKHKDVIKKIKKREPAFNEPPFFPRIWPKLKRQL